jgi:Zn-dependent M28 family amino/carboxypeptidase
VVGAHLDSVENHGINDNGSGSAAILEIALQMYNRDVPPKNKVRFAFWGAEELGLLGSTYYVEKLSRNERRNIELYLNFDMLGSPNYVRFVYDSDEGKSKNSLPGGSEQIEEVFYDYFQEKDLPAEPIDLTGRSDHAPFAEIEIPVGGLFSGIGGQKTQEQVDNYGGDLGEPYDPCNHKPCDDITNINDKSLDELSRAAAYAVDYFARSSDAVKECCEQKEKTPLQRGWLANESEYIGPLLRK